MSFPKWLDSQTILWVHHKISSQIIKHDGVFGTVELQIEQKPPSPTTWKCKISNFSNASEANLFWISLFGGIHRTIVGFTKMKLFQVNTTINNFEDNSSLTPILKIVHSKLMIYATICNTKETPKEQERKRYNFIWFKPPL